MMALSLKEAADQAGISKVDVWRAIQSGHLPALKSRDGGFIIDPDELFRVFERPASACSPEPPPPPEAPGPIDNDAAKIGIEMAELATELKLLLGGRSR